MPPIGLVPQSQGRLADCVARAPPAGPSPLEVIAAEPAGDIHRLAYEIEAFYRARSPRPGGKPRGIDAACGHFRLCIAFRSCGREAPFLVSLVRVRQLPVGHVDPLARNFCPPPT